MRVLALVPSVFDTAPGQRFRIEQWDASLRESGVEIVYAPFECEGLHSIISSRGKAGATPSPSYSWLSAGATK